MVSALISAPAPDSCTLVIGMRDLEPHAALLVSVRLLVLLSSSQSN